MVFFLRKILQTKNSRYHHNTGNSKKNNLILLIVTTTKKNHGITIVATNFILLTTPKRATNGIETDNNTPAKAKHAIHDRLLD